MQASDKQVQVSCILSWHIFREPWNEFLHPWEQQFNKFGFDKSIYYAFKPSLVFRTPHYYAASSESYSTLQHSIQQPFQN